MKFKFIQVIIPILISSFGLQAQYDAGTVIYSQTSDTDLTSISKNYIIEDFDGDFNADIIMVKTNSVNNNHQLTWYKGDGNGNFAAQSNLLSVGNWYKGNEIFYEDMNGDGNKDIVFQNNDTGFTILLNDGQGNITNQMDNQVTRGSLWRASLKEVADVDGDGDMDCIFSIIIRYSYNDRHYYCSTGHNNGTGTFSNYTDIAYDNSSDFYQVETGDIDGDGDLDIICSLEEVLLFSGVLSHASVISYRNTGQNSYVPTVINLPAETNFANIKIQDLDTDGNDELLVEYAFENNCQGNPHHPTCDRFYLFKILDYNTQNDDFVTLEEYNTFLHTYSDSQFQIQFGHQNSDSNLDILSVNAALGKLQWYLGDGNGNFNNTQTVNTNLQLGFNHPTLRVADIDNDTDLDIFVLLDEFTSSTLIVFKNLALTPSCAPVLDLGNASFLQVML